MARLKLASASPRRADLLRQLGVAFDILPGACLGIDERVHPGESAESQVTGLARAKARHGAACPGLPADAVVLGADTVIVTEGELLGKPADEAQFMHFMKRLGGRTHEVLTAVAVAGRDELVECLVRTRVTMAPFSASRATAYWRSGEPADKAGGYAIQGHGALFVERVDGSCSAVIGLPLRETAKLIGRFDIFPYWIES
ncbi:MAG: Maf family protein [Halothiobacillaceae bacterium]